MTGARPVDIATLHTRDFIRRHAAPPAAILEIGGGEGDLASALGQDGYRVTMIDSAPDAIAAARNKGVDAHVATWPDFALAPVDVALFTRSLHHMHDLDTALAAARDVMTANGLLLVEDFAFEEADDATINALAGLARTIVGDRRLEGSSFLKDLLAANDPIEVWRAPADHEIHAISEIERSASRFFDGISIEFAPYFYRYLIPVLPQTGESMALVKEAFDLEARLIGDRRIIAIGRRIIGRR